MTVKHSRLRKLSNAEKFYTGFDRLDGQHPWTEAVPAGSVTYRVRELRAGKIAYFNFFLAKEMGLIDADHPHEMNDELEAKLISTFSIQIINEYDELSKRRIDPATIKPHPYMATRYLQLQHASKQGRTSGDGRGIWNGTFAHRGTTWDVSSRGTGVTCLAPGAVAAGRALKTGGTEFGYGCGQAEIDELLSAAILAESLHLQGFRTERVLCVVDLGRGFGIGVRAAQNLLRPAHLFLYLKQGRQEELRRGTEYVMDRQIANGQWSCDPKATPAKRYDEFLTYVCDSFAEFTALLDIDYVFAWLDWDGDNVLVDGGIIDYGSVRQFGIRHDRYRYDDVERFSTNLNEQRLKARQIVQVFAQMIDFLKTGKKKSLPSFEKDPILARFDRRFTNHRADRLLYRVGFTTEQRARILTQHRALFEKFDRHFSALERAKISGTQQRVADGVNHPALYNVRNLLRALPKTYLESSEDFESVRIADDEMHALMRSSFATNRDLRIGKKARLQMRQFQDLYKALVQAAAGSRLSPRRVLAGLTDRAAALNSEKRITGNALIEIVDAVLEHRRTGLPLEQVQKVIDRLVLEHAQLPEATMSRAYRDWSGTPAVRVDLYSQLLSIVRDNSETI